MKNLILLFILISLGLTASAQCTPDSSITHNIPGIYPDTVTGLPHAVVGQTYGSTINVKVITDTVYLGFTVPIDSVTIDNVNGLPPGFNFSCTPSTCGFPGGSNGCIFLFGPAPTPFMAGSYAISVDVTAYGRIAGTPTHISNTINGYKIVIDTTTGISGIEKLNFSIGQNTPNPARSTATIPVTLQHPDDVTVSISNLLGKEISSHVYNLQKGKNSVQVDVRELQPGIYLYSVSNGKNTVTRRMIISND